jgi:uncharacterized protein YdiU (UPF0061 family)
MKLNINDTFNNELPADPDISSSRRQVKAACFSYVKPRKLVRPVLIHASKEVVDLIGLQPSDIHSAEFLNVFSGNQVLPNTKPYAMCYGGHQFGHWAGQLGDGRAINLAEVVHDNERWALQLKGAGETPYSRSADGLAVLRSSIREHLCSEAMYHLGVPTTRSLSLILTGEEVLRDVMYDGNAAYEKGAVVCRVAPSFIRFGNFQIFAARQDVKTLKELAEYTIRHFYPDIERVTKSGYIRFFHEVAMRTLDMVIHWQRVGFVHGVMNTDNMSILGLTIDYGPYGWLEGYDPAWTPNTTDREQRRYRFGHQAQIALWNLFQLANALYPLIDEAAPLEEILEEYKIEFARKYLDMMRSKLGLAESKESDRELILELEEVLQLTETDMTIFFRNLAKVNPAIKTDQKPADVVADAFYFPKELTDNIQKKWNKWFSSYIDRIRKENLTDTQRATLMNKTNPKYVLRNYMAQLIIDDADKGDYTLLNEIHELLKSPYDANPSFEKWFSKRPDWARDKVGCSMLSCSS